MKAWGTLLHQWSLAFAIGEENRRRGLRPTPLATLLREIWNFARSRSVSGLSD
jgi:hypothetical protein